VGLCHVQFRRSANFRAPKLVSSAVSADDEFGKGQQLVLDEIVGIYPFDLVGGYGRNTQIVFNHQVSRCIAQSLSGNSHIVAK